MIAHEKYKKILAWNKENFFCSQLRSTRNTVQKSSSIFLIKLPRQEKLFLRKKILGWKISFCSIPFKVTLSTQWHLNYQNISRSRCATENVFIYPTT